jgi:hypothetical protein
VRRLTAVAVSVLALVAGCGIPAEPDARTVQPPPGPYGSLITPAPSAAAGTVAETLFLTRDQALIPVVRRLPGPRDVRTVMAELLAAPNDADQDDGLSSALPGGNLTGDVSLTGALAIVSLTAAPDGSGRSDQMLAFAQVVCTLDAQRDVAGVIFTLHGDRVGVPRADGALSEGPLTTADYAVLIADP